MAQSIMERFFDLFEFIVDVDSGKIISIFQDKFLGALTENIFSATKEIFFKKDCADTVLLFLSVGIQHSSTTYQELKNSLSKFGRATSQAGDYLLQGSILQILYYLMHECETK